MKAITVKYLGPTDYKGARLKAYDSEGNQLTVSREYDKDVDVQSMDVAHAFMTKMDWWQTRDYHLAQGYIKEGYVHVIVPNRMSSQGR